MYIDYERVEKKKQTTTIKMNGKEKQREGKTPRTRILRQPQNRMFARRVLHQHRRGHETRTAGHVDDDAPRRAPPRVLPAHRSRVLLLHRGRLRARGEEHAEDVDVEEALELAHGRFGDFGGGLDADLSAAPVVSEGCI